MYNNKYSDQLLPLITPEMLTRYPDQTCDILNKLIRLAQQSSSGESSGGEPGNLEDIVQTSTSYADGGVNIVTAYLSDGTTQDFQIRNGHKGSQGETGDPGQDATVSVGTTSTLPAGSDATVTNTGTPSAAVFNFGIPKGDKGDTGSTGQAATIAAGTTTTLSPGSSATVTNSGTSSAAVFDFGIPQGDKGDTGAPGADGFSPIATVSKVGDTATITITDENGTTTASVSDGADGQAATITAGTTTTLPAGSSATVTNSGTSSAAIFDFGIPKGDKGDTGNPGSAATISVGSTSTLPAGSSATVTNSGTSSAAVFDFGIPKGDTGAAGPANTLSIGTVQSGATADATITGTSPNQTLNLTLPKGDTGTAATIAAGTTTTLAPGSSATVTNSGTSSAAVFDFGIPQGDKGDTGDAATIAAGTTTTLPAGSSATVTNSGTSSAAVFDFGIPKGADAPLPEVIKHASGTTIELTDAGPGFDSVQLYGDTTQTTYTGKNIINGAYGNQIQLQRCTGASYLNGIQLTRSQASGAAYTSFAIPDGYLGKTLTLSFQKSGATTITAKIFNYVNNQAQQQVAELSTTGGTFTMPASVPADRDGFCVVLYIDNSNGVGTVGSFWDIQLEESNQATSFEPYVGGTASPNPDYHQPVNTATGLQTITAVGKNLWNPVPYKTGYTIAANGTDYALANGAQWEYKGVTPSTEYTLSATASSSAGTIRIHAFDGAGNWIEQITTLSLAANASGSVTFTTPANIGILRWSFFNDASDQQLEKGSSATTYEPYNGRTTTVNLGKNLFDGTYVKYAIGGTDQRQWFSASNCRSMIIPCKPSTTYTVTKFTAGNRFSICDYPTLPTQNILLNKLFVDQNMTTGSVTVTTHADAAYLMVFVSNESVESQVQVEVGSTVTTYAPYFTPIELCKIGTYQDYIYKSGDDWYIHKAIGKETLPTSGYTLWNTHPTACLFYQNVEPTNALFQNGLSTILAESFTTKPQVNDVTTYYNNYGATDRYGLTFKNGTHGVIIQNKDCADATAFHTWIASSPVTIYYTLATSTDTQITNATLISELEALLHLTTCEGNCDITIRAVSPDLPAILDVDYFTWFKGERGEKGDPGKGCPVGTILPFSGSVIPDNYLECDGSAVSRTTYAELYNVIGTTYGSGDGSTTFNLPNLQGRIAVGQDTNDADFDTLGETGGEKTHTLTTSEMPRHQHTIENPYNVTGSNQVMIPETIGTGNKNSSYYNWQPTGYSGGDGAHNNLQPYIVTKYIIKCTDSAAVIAEIVNTQSSSMTDTYSAGYVENNFQAKDSVYTFTKTLSGTSQNWTDTGITNADLPTGTYAMQIEATSGKIGMWNPVYSATIAWQNLVSNDSRTNEILLMHMGHADNGEAPGQRLYLRILQQTGSKAQKLQYAMRLYYNDTTTATFTFRRLI